MSGMQQICLKVVCRLVPIPQNTLIFFPPKMQFSDEKLKILKGKVCRHWKLEIFIPFFQR